MHDTQTPSRTTGNDVKLLHAGLELLGYAIPAAEVKGRRYGAGTTSVASTATKEIETATAAALAPAVTKMATTPSEVNALLRTFRDEELEAMRRLYPDFIPAGKPALGLGGISNETWFGNIFNERVRQRVITAIDSGALTNLKMTRQGQKGVDFRMEIGAGKSVGFDLFTASTAELLKHEQRILNQLAPDLQSIIVELFPLMYTRQP